MRSDRVNYWELVLFLIISALLCSHTSYAQERWVRVVNLEGKWKFSIGDKPSWANTYYDDKGWEDIHVPSKWEDEGFHGYNGYAWYRKTFDGSALENNNYGFNLFLGYIDDVDEVFLNGHKIGYSGSFPPKYHTAYNARRNYYMPREFINFNGKNVISVRVYDSEIEGGIIKGEVGIYTNKGDLGLPVNLRGVWSFRLTGKYREGTTFDEKTIDKIGASPETDGWADINVPDHWDNQGYGDYDGGAWYRRRFVIPRDLAGEDLVLLLGKIDDSDRTYLNGKLVGSSTDQHDRLRIYHVGVEHFKVGETNTLLIYVEDPHGHGGIYEGPVGIMKQADFTKFIRWR